MKDSGSNRRPIAARDSGWARRIAATMARSSITPNQISMASIVFAGIGAALLAWWPTWTGLLLCACCVQLRLVCNLIDGMVAVEGGKGSVFGRIYNEFPDRVTDSMFIVALGYACGAQWLGWLGALLAVATAYVRVFGGSLGLAQDFRGPLAKAQRMAVLTVACVLASVAMYLHADLYAAWVLWTAAVVIAAGSLLTCVVRTLAIAKQLRTSP